MAFEIKRLKLEHDRSQFCSGNADLDRFFVRYAGQNQFRHHIGTTYVAIDKKIRATIAGSRPPTMPNSGRKPFPQFEGGDFRSIHCRYYALLDWPSTSDSRGRVSVVVCFGVCYNWHWRMAEEVGCSGVLVDAKPEAVAFYERLGFLRLEVVAGELGDRPQPEAMFLELGVLADFVDH